MSHLYYIILNLINTCHVFINKLLGLIYTVHVLIIQYYIFLTQITYVNTLIHIYEQINFYVLKNTNCNWKKCKSGHPSFLPRPPKSQRNSYSDYYLHLSSTMVRSWCKLTLSLVLPPQNIVYNGLWLVRFDSGSNMD